MAEYTGVLYIRNSI